MDTMNSGLELYSFDTEKQCEDYLLKFRWAQGFCCPRCDHHQAFYIRTRRLLECKDCRMQVSLTAGTIMHKSKLSLLHWFQAIQLLIQTDKIYTASSLSQMLKINYRSAQLLLKKINFAFVTEENWLIAIGKPRVHVTDMQDKRSSDLDQAVSLSSFLESKLLRMNAKLTFRRMTASLCTGSAGHRPFFGKWVKLFTSIHLYRSFFKCYQIPG
ncbi:transposase [Paenibacillus sp. HWE-109]|uniref:transposase n=1 Tax=Paenibacillus sp. HWE-109 TaxID=1306526 RepID=UPI001EE12D8E|nr:transposase [Paenibacillus sp. HWE-109]UKS30753.1 transposase [Paenibacillus sp. HWE-109]